MNPTSYNQQIFGVSCLYPNNRSLEEELHRLLGNYLINNNDFVQNGRDSEYCPDDTYSVNYGPPVGHSSPLASSYNNSFFSDTSSPNPCPYPQPIPEPSPPRPQPPPPPAQRRLRSAVFNSTTRPARRNRYHCSFCKKNGERPMVFESHNLKTDDGIITCPVLRNYTCPICNANGDSAHTLKYCPYKASY